VLYRDLLRWLIDLNDLACNEGGLGKPGLDAEAERKLQSVLDHSKIGFVSQYKFSEFLKGFGPFNQCANNVKHILSQKWFYGFLSSGECQSLLTAANAPEGTYMMRFSKSKPGSFALAFVNNGQVRHILIESDMPNGFRVPEQKKAGQLHLFKSLQEIINHYNVLTQPFIWDLPLQDWFHGDVDKEEAKELLQDQPDGTFLIRFSTQGCFAASFMNQGQLHNVLINNQGMNTFTVNDGQVEKTFSTLQELVQHYRDKGLFKMPLITTN